MKQNLKKILIILLPLILQGCTLGGTKNTNKTYNIDKKIQEDWNVEYGISSDTLIQEVNIDTAMEKLKEDKGILVLSSPDCQYCQTAFPLIDELSKEYQMNNIYYVDAGTINQEKRKELNVLLDNTLKTNPDGTISLVVPDVYAITNGEVLGNQRKTLKEEDKLKNVYEDLFKKVK